MINKIAKKMALFFCENKIIEEKYAAVYEYGLELLLTSVLEMLAVIIISIIIGKFLVTLLFLLSFCMLRTYAGGFHASTNFRCFLVLLFVYLLLLALLMLVTIKNVGCISIFFSTASEIIVIIFAPVDNESKRLTEEESKNYRKISLAIVSIETLIVLILVAIKWDYIIFGVSYGQLAAAVSLLAVKIINMKRGQKDENVKGNG